MTTPSVTYDKANSFLAMSGAGGDLAAIRSRVATVQANLAGIADSYRRSILERACRALLGQALPGEPAFELRPHVVAELERIADSDLGRYLFYRYRYDVFPVSRELDAFPPCVQIEPTSICNYRCVFCYQVDGEFTRAKGGHMGMMPVDTFKRVVDELQGNVEAVTLASRGEPMAAKGIDEMLAYAAGKFLALKINTNASLLDERKAHAILSADPQTLVFSADSADPEQYSRLRVNGKLDRVLANIQRFRDIKAMHYSGSRTVTRVSGVRYGADQDFAAIESFWGELVDQVAFVNYNPWENAYDQPANGLTTPCSDLWRRTFVWWDGRVNPCDVDYRSTLAVGAVGDQGGVSASWVGEGYERLRRAHVAGERGSLKPCLGCTVI